MSEDTLEKAATKAEKYVPKKGSIVLNRYTKVTEENLDLLVPLLAKSCQQMMKSLRLDKLKKEDQERTLKVIIARECLLKDFPLIFLIEGSFRMSDKSTEVTYYGRYAAQLYTYQAEKSNQPIPVSIDIKYIVENLGLIVQNQDKIKRYIAKKSFLQTHSDHTGKELEVPQGIRFIPVRRDKIVDAELHTDRKESIYIPIGDYSICGVTGVMRFSDGSSFENTYYIDPEQTKLSNFGNPTAYAKAPLQFIETKFIRHTLKNYYVTKIPVLPEVSNVEEDVTETEISERYEELAAQMESRQEKLKELNGN